jgi:hypothetical protein
MHNQAAFFFQGKQKEAEFRAMFSNMRESTTQEDRVGKFDMELKIKIDFKGIKRKMRSGPLDQNIHWVEMKNVGGNRGWLYGDADVFCFEIEKYYVVVSKEDLQAMIESRVDYDTVGKGLYQVYTRAGKKDLITMVPTVDLCAIAIGMIPKDEKNDDK